MPIYEYECRACGHQFEEWQKMSDSPIRKCPNCGRRMVDRLVSLSAFHLKGSGWYVTDYGGKNSGNKPGHSDESNGSDEGAKKTKKAKKTEKKASGGKKAKKKE